MKQVKPGRVPSLIGFIGSIIVIIFGIFWTGLAVSLAASHGGDPPIVFIIFGIVFIMAGIGSAIYNYKNAFGKNRISEYDIVEPGEEDISERLGASSSSLNYCPYCGSSIDEDFSFCPKCGKKLKIKEDKIYHREIHESVQNIMFNLCLSDLQLIRGICRKHCRCKQQVCF